MIYFPDVTNIKPLTRVRRERTLPRAGDVIVRSGVQVTPTTVVAQHSESGVFRLIEASKKLGVSAEALPDYLLANEGAQILKGTPLLRKKGRFGRSRTIKSPIDGVLHRVINGRLILQEPPRIADLRAMIPGLVIRLILNRGVIIETYGSLLQGAWGSGRSAVGKIELAVSQPTGVLTAAHISMDSRQKVLIAGRVADESVFVAASNNAVRAIVVGSLTARLARAARRHNLAIIATDGIGTQPMASPAFDLLRQSIGREASVLGEMDLTTGLRPELIIPLPADRDMEIPAGAGTILEIGSTVRLLREPFMTQVGEVTALYDHSRANTNGIQALGADVRLTNGQIIFVPYANLDLIKQ